MGKPADYANTLNGVMWFQVAVASVFIGLRMYTRYYIVRKIGWDDVLMILNLVSACYFHLTLRQRTMLAFVISDSC
jgi:hypothetical protein